MGSTRAGPGLEDVAGAQAEDVVEAAVCDGDVQQPRLGRVAVAHLGEAVAAAGRVAHPEGLPAGEQFGMFELKVLHAHRRYIGHEASFGIDLPQPGRSVGLRSQAGPLGPPDTPVVQGPKLVYAPGRTSCSATT